MSYRTITLIALLTTGCGTAISTTLINPAPRPMNARPPETVEIFSSGPPHRPYVDVAFLEAEQETHLSFDNTPELINHLRARAAAMGCDGVVLGGVTHAADVAASYAADVNASKKGITATCIVYPAESVAAAPRAPQVDPPAPTAPPAPPVTVDPSSN
jgi:hypothetical protein